MKTDKQLDAIRKTRNKELYAIHSLDPGFSCQGLVGKFIGVYMQSEVFARKLQRYYYSDTNKNGGDELNIHTLKAALKHFHLDISESDIAVLFRGGSGVRGSKSARQLRNGYLHSLSDEDKNEIISKAHTFLPKLQNFIGYEIVCQAKD